MARPKKLVADAVALEKKMSQRELVEAAIAAGVPPKSNIEIADWILKNHGIELDPKTQVAQAKKQMAKSGKSTLINSPAVENPTRQPTAHSPGKDVLTFVRDVKALADKVGGLSHLKDIVEAMGG